MKDLASIDFKDNVRFVVRRYLKTMGIKVPKQKSVKIQVSEFNCLSILPHSVWLSSQDTVNNVCSLCKLISNFDILKSLFLLQPSDDNKSGVFGVCLEKVPSINIGEDFYCSVPK